MKKFFTIYLLLLFFAFLSYGQTRTGGGGAGGGSSTFPLTVSGTVNSGGIPYFNSATQESSSAILNTNILVKGGGAGGAPSNSLFTDNGTTASYTGTGGISGHALTCGVLNTTACVITGYGSTSGTATLTWPATAGTPTNPVVMTNVITGPAGNNASPTYGFSDNPNTGIDEPFPDQVGLVSSNNLGLRQVGFSQTIIGSTDVIQWTNSSDASGTTYDTGISRIGAGVLAVGNSTSGDATGSFRAAGYISAGTTFTLSSNGCSATTLVGGATAGSVNSGTTGTCAFTVLMGNSATAAHGWSCWINDLTTTADVIHPTAAGVSTTSQAFTGATVSGDVLQFGCMGY